MNELILLQGTDDAMAVTDTHALEESGEVFLYISAIAALKKDLRLSVWVHSKSTWQGNTRGIES